MGSNNSEYQIPVIDLSEISPGMNRGTQEWRHLCERVRECCENYGCFEVLFDKISSHLRAETFSLMRPLYELPLETKRKNFNPKPYHGYAGQYPQAPLYESFGIEDASNYDSLQSFAQLMWPHGEHKPFCETVGTMMKQLEELHQTIEMLIHDSYGLGNSASANTTTYKTLLRMMRYKSPPAGEVSNGLGAHSDKLSATLLCEEEVSGLEIEKEGQWIKWFPSPNSFIYIVGDPLMAWSNGRAHAVKHRVSMSGDKDRYSLGAFQVPIKGSIIKPPKELVDQHHPQLLEAFDYLDFLDFSFTLEARAIPSERQVFAFAGMSN